MTAENPDLLICGGGPAGMMAGPAVRPRRREDSGAGEAWRFPARFPGRHRPSLDAGAVPRARCARRTAVPAARQGGAADRHHRRRDGTDRRFRPFAGAGALHRADAAMGVPRLRRGPRPRLAGLHAPHERGGHRPAPGGRPGHGRDLRRCADPGEAGDRRRRPPLAAPRRRRRCRSRISVRRSTFSGSGFRRTAPRTIAPPA